MKTNEELLIELSEFDSDRFVHHYEDLMELGGQGDPNGDLTILNTLQYIANMRKLIEDLKVFILKKNGEKCQDCKEKDELIEILKRNSPIKFEKIKNSKS